MPFYMPAVGVQMLVGSLIRSRVQYRHQGRSPHRQSCPRRYPEYSVDNANVLCLCWLYLLNRASFCSRFYSSLVLDLCSIRGYQDYTRLYSLYHCCWGHALRYLVKGPEVPRDIVSLCSPNLRVILKVKLGVEVNTKLSHWVGCRQYLEVTYFNLLSVWGEASWPRIK